VRGVVILLIAWGVDFGYQVVQCYSRVRDGAPKATPAGPTVTNCTPRLLPPSMTCEADGYRGTASLQDPGTPVPFVWGTGTVRVAIWPTVKVRRHFAPA